MLLQRDSGASHQKTDELKLSNPITNPIIDLIKMQFTLRKESYPKPESQDQRSSTLNSATPSLVELPKPSCQKPSADLPPSSTQASCASVPAPGRTFGSRQIAARRARSMERKRDSPSVELSFGLGVVGWWSRNMGVEK